MKSLINKQNSCTFNERLLLRITQNEQNEHKKNFPVTIEVLKNKRGEGYMDVVVLILCSMLVIAMAVKVFPAYIIKQQVDVFAVELIREAEIVGRIGTETERREQQLRERTGIEPEVIWSKAGRIQLNESFTVIVSYQMDIGLFGGFGSFPVTLRSKASGKGEVYWK